MRVEVRYIGLIIAALALGLALGFVLAQYTSGGMVMSFIQKLPGCF